MDVKKYIESGILEQYVLGKVSEKERIEVEQYAEEYPRIRQELNAIEEALEQYALLQALKPSAKVLENIQDRIKQGPGPPPRSSDNFWFYLTILLFLLAVTGGILMFNRNLQLRLERNTREQQLQALQIDCDERQDRLQQLERRLQILQERGNQPVVMKGTTKYPDGLTTLFWNPDNQQAYLDIVRLPDPPPGKQYQLWAIVEGQPPVNMDVFDIPARSGDLIEVAFIANPQAFAITLEEQGGSPAPTLTEMVVIGNV